MWALEIQQYTLIIGHVKAKANPVADALSRGLLTTMEELQETCSEEVKVVCSATAPIDSEWLVMLKYDPDYAPVIAALEKGDLNKEVWLLWCT